MNSKFCMLAIVSLILIGCAKSSTKPPTGDLRIEFRLTDAAGNQTETFFLGEDIFFEFTIINETEEELEWVSENNWPAARFDVYSGDLTIGSSFERSPWDQIILRGVLEPQEKMVTVSGWFDHSWHAPLAVGEYTASAFLNYKFEGFEPVERRNLEFEVIPQRKDIGEIFALYRVPAERGFCPIQSGLYYASLVKSDRYYILSGTLADNIDLATMPCPVPGTTDPCFRQVPFETLYFSENEIKPLFDLLESFPQEEHQVDYACDHCEISRYHFNGRIEVINPCASGSDAYWQVISDIEDLLDIYIAEY